MVLSLQFHLINTFAEVCMKIAIPSNDGKTVSKHFGRSEGFIIVEIEDNKIINKAYKKNDFTGHAQGLSHEHTAHGHGHHSHEGIFKALGDCSVVIAGGMGQKLYKDFQEKKVMTYLTNESDIDSVLEQFINGQLESTDQYCIH